MTSQRELVFALCHEVANLLAAARLEADLIREEASPAEAGTRIAAAAARAGALVAQIRPLLEPHRNGGAQCDPLEVLGALRGVLDEESDARVRIELRRAVDLPHVAVPAGVLHDVLLTAIYAGLDENGGRVEVHAEHRGDRVVFTLDDPGQGAIEPEGALRGRPLCLAIAEAVLRGSDGTVSARRTPTGTSVELSLRAAGA